VLFRLDSGGDIKVSDFGLPEDMYTRGYFKQSMDDSGSVHLPYKWLPPETFQDGIFSEKSDVVRYYLLVEGTVEQFSCYSILCSVSLWCYMLGGVYSWKDSVPCA